MGTSRVAEAITCYAASTRAALGAGRSGAISYAGLWLLLASLAGAARGDGAVRLGAALGLPVEEAREAARALLAEPHPTVASALGAWTRVELPSDLDLGAPVEPMPDQTALDAWAAERTRGLIERFPVTIDPLTGLVLASALVAEPRWSAPLRQDGDWLVLRGGRQAVVDTRAAGPVAVAVPDSPDGVDVVSVVAAPDVDPAAVWEAVDEVSALLDSGRLGDDPPEADGHAWTVRTEIRSVKSPDRTVEWSSRLPRWSARETTRLDAAPGVAEVVESIRQRVPELDGDDECIQSAVAEFTDQGFSAAAVTAIAMRMSAAIGVEREMRIVELDFSRAHAVVAIARASAWEGVPLFSCWVPAAVSPR